MQVTTKTVRFLKDAEIVNEGRLPRRYRAGEVYTLRIDQALRWVRRDMAVLVMDQPPSAILDARPEVAKMRDEIAALANRRPRVEEPATDGNTLRSPPEDSNGPDGRAAGAGADAKGGGRTSSREVLHMRGRR